MRLDCNLRVEHGHAQPVGTLASILFIEPVAAARYARQTKLFLLEFVRLPLMLKPLTLVEYDLSTDE